MDNIIKSDLTAVKIIKPDEYKLIYAANEYLHQTKLKCKRMLNDAQTRSVELKNEALRSAEITAQQENSVFINATLDRYLAQLNKIETSLFKVVADLLDKLAVDKISSKRLAKLIKRELSVLDPGTQIVIEANTNTLDKLRVELAGHADIDYKINNSLLEDDCICDTGLYLIKLRMNDTVDALLKQLNAN